MLRSCGARLHRVALMAATSQPINVSVFSRRHIAAAAAGAVPQTQPQQSQDKTTNSSHLPTESAAGSEGFRSDIRTHHERARKPQRAPLLRNFFAGRVDAELLAYPEPINREDMQTLDGDVQRVRDYFAGQSSQATDLRQQLDDLRQMGAFGRDVPAAWGGGNCTETELTRLAGAEVQAGGVRLSARLNAHRLAVRCIVESGSVEQQERWLPRLARGELVAAVAMYEAETPATVIFRTQAKPDGEAEEGGVWRLSGGKACVAGALEADVLVVFAQTETPDRCGDRQDTVTAFIVERTSHGVHVQPADQTISPADDQATVRFDGAAGEPLGEVGAGAAVAQRMLRCARLQTAVMSLAVQKKAMKRWTEFAVATGGSQELLASRLSRAHCSAYALESMLYLTTGLLDEYTDADVDVETAAVRIFALDALRQTASMGLQFAGAQATLLSNGAAAEDNTSGDGHLLTDALHVLAQGESADSLRLFVGLSGAQHAGEQLHDLVRKVRNPLYNPAFMLRRIFAAPNIEAPKCTLQLNHHLHPSLDPAAQWLEQSVLRLQAATEIALTRHGLQVLEKQCELQRLAEAAVQCYAAFAAISRASRAYCIGLQFADYEMLAAGAFAHDAAQLVLRVTKEVQEGPYLTNDANLAKLAAQVMRSGGYFAVQPLQRNF